MEDTGAATVHQLPLLIKEWLAAEDELRALSAAVREKRKRATTVRGMILKIMNGGNIGQLNISSGAVTKRTQKTKAPLTKKFIAETLTGFFDGNVEMAKKCAEYLDEHRPLRVAESLRLDAVAGPASP